MVKKFSTDFDLLTASSLDCIPMVILKNPEPEFLKDQFIEHSKRGLQLLLCKPHILLNILRNLIFFISNKDFLKVPRLSADFVTVAANETALNLYSCAT